MSKNDAPPKWEFDAPYTAVFKSGMYGEWLELLSHGFTVATFSVNAFGSHDACVKAAWNHAYGESEDLEAVKAQRDDLLAALEGLMAHEPDYSDTLWGNARDAIARARGYAVLIAEKVK